VAWLGRQTRRPDGIVVVGASPADVDGVELVPVATEIVLGNKGLCAQRNRGLDVVEGRADVVLFLDDDFVPADDYVAQLERLFSSEPDLVGATGWVLADGVKTIGISFDEAKRVLADQQSAVPAVELHREALYGCNMAVRLHAAAGLRFDEALPLYGWQEDIDFTYQLGQRGRMTLSSSLRGVHLGVKAARSSGVRLGYSQVANVVYLLRKRTIPRTLARSLLMRNVAMNALRSLWPEPHVDRRGRLRGNLLAAADLLRGRDHPMRILEL
jgi:glycosyltransferase involved in cell wall biosynthesis